MKKVLIYACMIFVPCVVFGATMCAKNNTLVIALDPKVAPTTYSYSGNKWTATFSSGIFKGVSTCVASSGGSMGSTTTGGVPLTAATGERNGQYCWCKLVHPVASRWVFFRDYGSASMRFALLVQLWRQRPERRSDARGVVWLGFAMMCPQSVVGRKDEARKWRETIGPIFTEA